MDFPKIQIKSDGFRSQLLVNGQELMTQGFTVRAAMNDVLTVEPGLIIGEFEMEADAPIAIRVKDAAGVEYRATLFDFERVDVP